VRESLSCNDTAILSRLDKGLESDEVDVFFDFSLLMLLKDLLLEESSQDNH